jgi:[acyl-carrier-protein] S-malonyltransferase
MQSVTVIHAFPAQGDFALTPLVGALAVSSTLRAALRSVSEITDSVVGGFGVRPLGPRLLGDSPPSLKELFAEATGSAQYALYLSSLALHLALNRHGHSPDRLVGMSFGDVVACAAAGMIRWEDGARIACLAAQALDKAAAGAMLLVESRTKVATNVEGAVRDVLAQAHLSDVVVACINHPGQLVLSGPRPSVTTAAQVLQRHRLHTTVLRLPFLAHHPQLRPAADDFREAIRLIPTEPPRLPVYSSVLGRAYRSDEDVATALARGLTETAHLPNALRQATGAAPVLILEAGTGTVLSSSAEATLARADVTARNALDFLITA